MDAIERAHYDIQTLLPSNDSRYFTPEEIDSAINWAVLELFNQQYKAFGETMRISDALDRFKVTTTVPLAGLGIAAIGAVPPDHIYTLNVLGTKLGGIEVQRKTKIVEEQFLAQYIDSEAFGPDETHVVVRFLGGNIQVYPNTFQECRITYFRKPNDAKYAYTLVGVLQNIPQYDPINSVQIDYAVAYYPQIIQKALTYLGVAQKDQVLMQEQGMFRQMGTPESR
jgi:hypothetical protein